MKHAISLVLLAALLLGKSVDGAQTEFFAYYTKLDYRVTHAALGGADPTGELILYGFTRQPAGSVAALAKSWNHPPGLTGHDGCRSDGYDRSQRAYVMAASGDHLSFTLQGSGESPVVNPCFVIKHWQGGTACRVSVNGEEIKPGPAFRRGIVHDTDGKPMLIVYLKHRADAAIRVDVAARPTS
jgi:hypothetical protein